MRELLTSLLSPPRCSGCGNPGRAWCSVCAAAHVRAHGANIGIPVIVGLSFDAGVRRTIIDWKDNGSRSARLRVQGWLADLVTPILAADMSLIVAPVPSSRSSDRSRGSRPLREALCAVVPQERLDLGLYAVRTRRDQTGLTRLERERNLHASMGWHGALDRPVLVVDDVITTGATMREAARAIRASATVPVLGCAIAQREHVTPVAKVTAGLPW